MPDEAKYTGGCHCGAVRFQVAVDLEGRIVACNCSLCAKTATLLAFVPAGEFTLLAGDGELADYQFGKKRIHHCFCRQCGVRSFARGAMPDGRELRAVNVRCLEGVDVDALRVTPFDGKSL